MTASRFLLFRGLVDGLGDPPELAKNPVALGEEPRAVVRELLLRELPLLRLDLLFDLVLDLLLDLLSTFFSGLFSALFTVFFSTFLTAFFAAFLTVFF